MCVREREAAVHGICVFNLLHTLTRSWKLRRHYSIAAVRPPVPLSCASNPVRSQPSRLLVVILGGIMPSRVSAFLALGVALFAAGGADAFTTTSG